MTNLYVSEIFHSIQGEGKHMGQLVSFIRLTGCNLHCQFRGGNFCDTAYAWKQGPQYSVDEVVRQVNIKNNKHVVISGGEPYLQKGLQELVAKLKDEQHYVSIETNGTIYTPTRADFVSISPKLKSSIPVGTKWEKGHEATRYNPTALFQLVNHHHYQMKFVVTSPADFDEIQTIKFAVGVPDKSIWLMPEGIDKNDLEKNALMTAELAIKHRFNYSDRLHVRLWGKKRGV